MNELVELQLRTGTAAPEFPVWKSFVLNVLRIICDLEPESASAESAEMLARLTAHRSAIAGAMHPQEERQTAAACVKTCDQYLRRILQDHTAREAELADMIGILREAAARFIGESSDFSVQLLLSADRLKTLTRLDDIRDLKQQLSLEVSSLERIVDNKKQRDQAAVTALSHRVKLLQDDLVKAEEQAAVDSLTKVPNRGALDRSLAAMIEAARKAARPLALAMIDIDNFKDINDTHGHQVGDRVLLCTAQWLQGAIRQSDFVGRYGGEEFGVVLVGANGAQAEARFKQVLREIAERSYEYEEATGQHKSVRFTVSCGVAELMSHDSQDDLVQRADQALYEAKKKGRNRVVATKVSRLTRLLSRG